MTPFMQLPVIPIEQSMKSDPIILVTFVASAVMLAFVIALGKRMLLQRGKNFFANRKRNSLFDAPTNIDWWVNIMMLLVLCLMAALTWMASMRDGYVVGVDYWKVMLLCTAVFAAYVVFKFIIYRLVCWAFYDAAGTKQWMDDYMTLLSYNGFMLFVLALAGVYFNISIHTLRHLATGLLICDKLLIVYKLSRLFFRPKIGRLTFFLQLCTLEILPCFILNEVLLEINIIFE